MVAFARINWNPRSSTFKWASTSPRREDFKTVDNISTDITQAQLIFGGSFDPQIDERVILIDSSFCFANPARAKVLNWMLNQVRAERICGKPMIARVATVHSVREWMLWHRRSRKELQFQMSMECPVEPFHQHRRILVQFQRTKRSSYSSRVASWLINNWLVSSRMIMRLIYGLTNRAGLYWSPIRYLNEARFEYTRSSLVVVIVDCLTYQPNKFLNKITMTSNEWLAGLTS